VAQVRPNREQWPACIGWATYLYTPSAIT
jgi:hypothetical protein